MKNEKPNYIYNLRQEDKTDEFKSSAVKKPCSDINWQLDGQCDDEETTGNVITKFGHLDCAENNIFFFLLPFLEA